MSELVFFWPLILVAIGWAIVKLGEWIPDLWYGDGGETRRHVDFVAGRQKNGSSYQEAMSEKYLREQIVALREIASVAVDADIENWHDRIVESIAEICQRIAIERPELLQTFTDAIAGLSYGHILYPTQAEKIDRYAGRGARDLTYDPNRFAALLA